MTSCAGSFRRRVGRRGAAGFTLLELIVAAGILALIAVFSWRGLDALIREREAIAASQDVIDRLQRSFARIERDAMLAGDAEVDERAMRLVGGTSGADGTAAPAVEYRVVDGALTRALAEEGGAPMVLLDAVTAVGMEVWLPAPRGGAWVRVKGPASAPRPVAKAPAAAGTATAPGTSDPNGNGNGTMYPTTAPSTGLGTSLAPPAGVNAPGGASAAAGPQAPIAPVAAATGIRLTIARANGTTVTRSFLVGGG